MANERFTPGPWKWEGPNLEKEIFSYSLYRGTELKPVWICDLRFYNDYPSRQDLANLNLIAAAPAMYKALKSCKHIAEMLQSGFDEDNSEYQMLAGCLKEIEAALAAANPETINT